MTGGDWQLPDLFINRGASVIFEKFYSTYRRSYRLTYTPKGVARQGWHTVSVTVPKYSSYTVSAKPGYAFEARPPASIPLAEDQPAAATVDGLVAAYERANYAALVDGLRQVKDLPALIEAFDEGGNPWPDRPKREAAFVLELAHAALASGQRGAMPAVQKLLDKHRLLVRDPLGPESFERYWLWAALAILQGVNAPALTDPFATAALARFPDEPRLLLAKAFLLDRRQPFASGAESRTEILVPQMAGGAAIPARVSVLSAGLPARHVREVSDAYDRVMAPDEIGVEARIRKSLLLYRAGQPREALALLDSAGGPASDVSLQYLRDLLRGRALQAVGSVEEAAAAYQAALGHAPQAQSPHVGLMALALLRGDREGAAAIADRIQKASPGADPWWNYWEGDHRLVPAALARLRAQTR